MYEPYKQYLFRAYSTNKNRQLPAWKEQHSKNYLNFSTNDYLGLSSHPLVIEAGVKAGQAYGVGATGSRLLSGNYALCEVFEARIAQDKKKEAALIFNTGFQANISVLAALLNKDVLGQRPLVFLDKYNHASLYNAVFLSVAEWVRYRHNDMNHLECLLKKYKNDSRPKFLVAETIFGMDGDCLPLEALAELAKKYSLFLYLDEAHATGIIGRQGYGLSTLVNLEGIPHVIMGTFSKALGCSGGYVACDQIIKDYLLHKASGFIYSTAPSPMVVGAAFQAWKMVPELENERVLLTFLSTVLREKLYEKGFDTGLSTTHIIPLLLKQEAETLRIKNKLFEQEIFVSAIRPPTVPPATSRIRLSVCAYHKEQDIERLLEALGA